MSLLDIFFIKIILYEYMCEEYRNEVNINIYAEVLKFIYYVEIRTKL